MYPNCYPYIFNRKKDRKKKERSNKKNKKERFIEQPTKSMVHGYSTECVPETNEAI